MRAVSADVRSPSGGVSRDAAWSLIYLCIVRSATLGLSVAVARLQGASAAGAFGITLQVTALAVMVAAFNLPQSLARHLAATDDVARRRTLLRTSARIVTVLGAVASALLTLIAPWLAGHVYGDPTLTPVLRVTGALVLTTIGYTWVEGALQGMRRFAGLVRWGSLVAALDLGFGVFAAQWGVVGVIVSRTAIRAVAIVAAAVRWIVRDAGTRLRGSSPAVPASVESLATADLLGFAGPALLAAAIVLAGQWVLRLMLVRGSGLEAAGLYQTADSIAQVLLLVPGAASVAFMRSVAAGTAHGDPFEASLRRALAHVVGINTAAGLALIGLSRPVILLVFGPGFAAAAHALALLAAAYALAGPAAVFGAAILGRAEVWRGVAINVLWVAVMLGLFPAVARWGATGAALAVAVAYLALLAVCLMVVAPAWRVRVLPMLPSFLGPLVAVAVCASLALAPRVPAVLSITAALVAALVVFARWGVPAAQPLLAWAGMRRP